MSRMEAKKDLVELELGRSGWEDRVRVIAIHPELESWAWAHGLPKPPDPKSAMIKAMEKKKRRRSAGVFGEIARNVPLERCRDPAFHDLRDGLRKWFPAGGP